MNKKFSTLVAGLAMLTAVSANAQVAEETPDVLSVVKTSASEVALDQLTKYVHLTDGTTALAVEDGKVVAVALAGLTADKVNAALWEVKAGAKDPATGTATYVFTNKATGAALNFDKAANKAKPVLVAGTTNWVWDASKGLTNAAKNVSIAYTTEGVTIVENGKGTAVKAYKAATYYLTAAGLNDFYGNGFALSFDKDIEGNPFTATSLMAEKVATSAISSTTEAKDLYVRLNIPGSKKYVSVDTTLYTRQGIQQILGNDGIGYKLTTDTLVYNDNYDPAKHIFSTKPEYMYHFRFTLDPAAADNEGKLTIEVKTPMKDQTEGKEGSRFVTDETYTNGKLTDATVVKSYPENVEGNLNFLSWTLFENGTKYLSTSNDLAKVLPIITFKAGNYADVEDGAYYVVAANKFTKQWNADKTKFGWVKNEKYGTYAVVDGECNDGELESSQSNNVYNYMANTQWAVNKIGKGLYSIVNREYATVGRDAIKLYELGDNTYAIGGQQDTIKLIPVEGADKFVGYKNFTEQEAHEMVFGLKVASGIADAFVGGVNKDGVLKLVKADELNDETQKFTLEKVGQTYELVEGSTVDSLVYNVYALKEVGGYRYLAGLDNDNNVKLANNGAYYAFAFKNTVKAGEYKMLVYNDSGETVNIDIHTGLALTDEKIAEDKLEEDVDYKVVYKYEAYGQKAAGSVSDAKFTWTSKCDNKFADRFSIVAAPKAEYATLEAGHKNISTLEDDAKFMTMFTDGLAVLKTAEQAMGDTTVTAENLGLWLEEANMEDVVKPLYYITTARGLSEEDQKAGLRYYMVSLKDSVDAEDYTGYDRKVGFVLGAAQGDSALAIVSTKDSLAIETSPAAVAFELTDVEGYYRIVLPGLMETQPKWAYDEESKELNVVKNEWGEIEYETVPATYKYLAVQNNVLYLSDKTDAYLFAVNPTEVFPTNNEAIDAEAVKVIAGNGTVTIQGAAGKSVVISNILGKVVAETVLTSDNDTIVVPAGIVAVAVEGEEAVKVVVK